MRKSECSLTERGEHFYSFCSSKKGSQQDVVSVDALRQMLLMLTSAQRETVLLYLLDGLSVDEIAAELSISKQAVYSRIHSARKKLKKNAVYFYR